MERRTGERLWEEGGVVVEERKQKVVGPVS